MVDWNKINYGARAAAGSNRVIADYLPPWLNNGLKRYAHAAALDVAGSFASNVAGQVASDLAGSNMASLPSFFSRRPAFTQSLFRNAARSGVNGLFNEYRRSRYPTYTPPRFRRYIPQYYRPVRYNKYRRRRGYRVLYRRYRRY